VLEPQIARMVKDWRIRALVDNFGGQWLQIRNIWDLDIDHDTFPKWKDNLKGMMKEETERFLEFRNQGGSARSRPARCRLYLPQ